MTGLGKVYIVVCCSAAALLGVGSAKLAWDTLDVSGDIEDIKESFRSAKADKKAKKAAKKAAELADEFDDDDDDYDDEDDDPAAGSDEILNMMNAQNSAVAGDPVQ